MRLGRLQGSRITSSYSEGRRVSYTESVAQVEEASRVVADNVQQMGNLYMRQLDFVGEFVRRETDEREVMQEHSTFCIYYCHLRFFHFLLQELFGV